MKLNKIISMFVGSAAALSMFSACSNEVEMHRPPRYELPDLPVVADVQTGQRAPLYWSVYEYCFTREQAGETTIDIPEADWDAIIDFVATELKPAGYNMICTDGFCQMAATDGNCYMTKYGSMMLSDLIAKCAARGLELGVYDNPLWIHASDETLIPGTEYNIRSLRYNGTQPTVRKCEDKWFQWIMAEAPGTRDYIDGFFKHYAEMGVKYIRMDFLSWYEDGYDRNMGDVGRGYGREAYARVCSYIAESAKKYGIFTSMVMPHLYSDAQVERLYGNMVRIVSDTSDGGWWHCSAGDRGKSYTNWPNCMNMFDGFVYWSHISGRDKVILDGDFTRLNKFETDAEKETVISLQLMAGGPIAASDRPELIGNDAKFYTNAEMLALNTDRFVGKPLSDKLNDPNNQIWYGQMTDGSYVIGIFNRNDAAASTTVKFADLGIEGAWNVRDLWAHADEGSMSSITANLAPHGCKIVKLTK